MKRTCWMVLVCLALVFMLAPALPSVPARADGVNIPATGANLAQNLPANPSFDAGNYCISCHVAGDTAPAQVLDWNGGIERAEVAVCPAATQVREQLYLTERLLLAVQRARTSLPGAQPKLDERLAGAQDGYSRLLDTPVTSLDAFTSEAQSVRYNLGKVYGDISTLRDALKRRNVMLVAGLVTVALLLVLGWGFFRTTARLGRSPTAHWLRPSRRSGAFLAAVLIIFALPIFREVLPAAQTTDQPSQTALDLASRAAVAADRAQVRAAVLGTVGAMWAAVNPQQGQQSLDAALTAAVESGLSADAMWGEAQAVREGVLDTAEDLNKAGLAAQRLESVRLRAWPQRLMAAGWLKVDPEQAAAVLRQALAVAEQESIPYRDLDLQGIAVTWAAFDRSGAVGLAEEISDPSLRAWALRSIVQAGGDRALYEKAAAEARLIQEPVARAHALSEIGRLAGNQALYAEAATALGGLGGAARAFAAADLAAASGDGGLASQIDPAYPAARALAFERLGQIDPAWAEAGRIVDPFDRARAQAAIAQAAGRADLARQISIPVWRDRVLAQIAGASRDSALARSIATPYYRVQALTATGDFEAAAGAAGILGDRYPVRGLALAWAATDPQAALKLVDLLDREADRAGVLRVVAAKVSDAALFQRALDMALAARVRGDATAPVVASMELGRAVQAQDRSRAEAAYSQAFAAAQKINTKYR